MEDSSSNHGGLVEKRDKEHMDSPLGRNPSHRNAYFLNPSLNIIKNPQPQDDFYLPKTLFSSQTTNFDLESLPLEVAFSGWKISIKGWKDGKERLYQKHKDIWIKVGIDEAIEASTYEIPKNKDLILSLAQKWYSKTNTFIFSWDEESKEMEAKLDRVRLNFTSTKARKFNHLPWLKCFFMKKISKELKGSLYTKKYLPHRVGMQFGLDQDIPGKVDFRNMDEIIVDPYKTAWTNYSMAITDTMLLDVVVASSTVSVPGFTLKVHENGDTSMENYGVEIIDLTKRSDEIVNAVGGGELKRERVDMVISKPGTLIGMLQRDIVELKVGVKEESAGRKWRRITQAPKKQYTQTLSRSLSILLQEISIVSKIIEAEIVEMERALETKKSQLLKRMEGLERKMCYVNSINLINLKQSLWHEYEQVLLQEELIWYMKARSKWLSFGDRNTKYFHASTMTRRKHNRIEGLTDDNGYPYLASLVIGVIPQADLHNTVSEYGTMQGTWNWAMFNHILPQEILDVIDSVLPPNNNAEDDSFSLMPSSNGIFSIKSAY
ncbi:Serine/threonine protein phosphatase 7 long form isogeny [Senna tora]|uniref:Serine/threonine protein phosphatase 7 long form isogeny n=1 Tax=Senna tora TaxID=362788 RepID=A0A834W757_9FABA|nr:Serine/threonine protein phosphatase 7 long form isogeny [Senna tora]